MKQPKGILYLIPTPLADETGNTVYPLCDFANSLSSFIVEDARTARRWLKKAGFTGNFDDLTFHVLNEQTLPEETLSYLDDAENGKDIGLLSEAGLPCVADPGALMVSRAHERGIQVIPLPGPSSIFQALMASGFNGQRFTFHGYLPIEKSQRIKHIREMEKKAWEEDATQIFMETPYRNQKLFEVLLNSCRASTRLCIASDLGSTQESIRMRDIGSWRSIKPPDLNKRPSIFLIYR